MASSKQVVGNPTPRVEGELKVSGAAKYAVDITVPGMLWGKLLRSPIASGKIKSINTSQAEALPGVYAVVTGEDCAGLKIGRRLYDMPILADGEVRFVGEKVAAVAGGDELIAEEGLTLIEVEYEETKPLLDPVEALKPGAKLLHPDVVNYKGLPKPLKEPTNDFVYVTWGKCDLETGFRQGDIIVENTFTTPVVHQSYIEPHSCVVSTAADGSAEFWSCSKVPYGVREQVANALKLPQEKLNFNPVYIGGDFGGKGDFMDLAVVYLLAKKARRAAKLVMDYEEEFTAGNPRHASIIQVKTGVKKDGTLVAHHMSVVFDSGAYGPFKPNALVQWTPAGGIGTVAIALDENGVATISSAMADQGAGTYTVLSEIVAEERKIPLSQIRIRQLATQTGVKDTGVGGSRATRVYGNAGYAAALKAADAIKAAAAEQTGAAPDQITLAKGAALHPRMERRLTYGEIVKAKGSPIAVDATFNDNSKIHAASTCVQVAEVEVDPQTGQVELKKFTSTHNTGTVLNPLMHQGQIEGASMTGIGYTMMEEVIINDGKVATTHFGEYKIPTIKDIPVFKGSVTEAPHGAGPYDSMPIGETGNIPTAAAIANAVEDACGIRIKDLPITAEKIYAALHGAK